MLITKPDSTEYSTFYESYINKVENPHLLEALAENTVSFTQFIQTVPESKGGYAYAPAKWTIKEVLLHIIDSERIFCYRALLFARNDKTELPGFNENLYVPNSHAKSRTLQSLSDEFMAVRQATLTLFNSFEEEDFYKGGIANGYYMSVRALGFAIAGHTLHHTNVLKQRYL